MACSQVDVDHVKGEIPETIDHENGKRGDNFLSNLRLATLSEQACNTKRRNNNTSGIKGVSRRGKYWIGQVVVRGVNHNKTFKKQEDAVAWRQQKAKELHGEFYREI